MGLIHSRLFQGVHALHLPPLRNVPDPLDTRGLEFDIRVQAAGDGTVDANGPLLLQEFDLALLLGNQFIDLGGLFVEEGDDAVLTSASGGIGE